jgi:hypothetical protein
MQAEARKHKHSLIFRHIEYKLEDSVKNLICIALLVNRLRKSKSSHFGIDDDGELEQQGDFSSNGKLFVHIFTIIWEFRVYNTDVQTFKHDEQGQANTF